MSPVSGGGSTATAYGAAAIAAVPASGVLIESIPRWACGLNNQTLTSGRVGAVLMRLPAGVPITTLTYLSGSQAAVVALNQWAGIYTTEGVMVRQSADATIAAWDANTSKAFTLSTPYTPSADELAYISICVVASTVPNFVASSTQSTVNDITTRQSVRTAAAFTTPVSAAGPITFDTALASTAYIRLS